VKRPVVLALNPSVDAEWRVDGVQWEEKNTVQSERRWAGGKGVNVARWLGHLGSNPLLILPLGGDAGREIKTHLTHEKITAQIIPIQESSRVNVIVTAGKQGQLRFNPHGPELSHKEWRTILDSVREACATASLMILSGSLPRGISVTAYAEIIRLTQRAGVPVLLDCDGPVLEAAVPAKPFFIKPNEHELAGWTAAMKLKKGTLFATRHMSFLTGGWVLVSRGAKSALLMHEGMSETLTEVPVRLKPRNTVGAGDAMLAAVARQMELGAAPRAWLHEGLAAGTAATQCRPGKLP
jgi:1-phosphofructokinase family hexose kinase